MPGGRLSLQILDDGLGLAHRSKRQRIQKFVYYWRENSSAGGTIAAGSPIRQLVNRRADLDRKHPARPVPLHFPPVLPGSPQCARDPAFPLCKARALAIGPGRQKFGCEQSRSRWLRRRFFQHSGKMGQSARSVQDQRVEPVNPAIGGQPALDHPAVSQRMGYFRPSAIGSPGGPQARSGYRPKTLPNRQLPRLRSRIFPTPPSGALPTPMILLRPSPSDAPNGRRWPGFAGRPPRLPTRPRG